MFPSPGAQSSSWFGPLTFSLTSRYILVIPRYQLCTVKNHCWGLIAFSCYCKDLILNLYFLYLCCTRDSRSSVLVLLFVGTTWRIKEERIFYSKDYSYWMNHFPLATLVQDNSAIASCIIVRQHISYKDEQIEVQKLKGTQVTCWIFFLTSSFYLNSS